VIGAIVNSANLTGGLVEGIPVKVCFGVETERKL